MPEYVGLEAGFITEEEQSHTPPYETTLLVNAATTLTTITEITDISLVLSQYSEDQAGSSGDKMLSHCTVNAHKVIITTSTKPPTTSHSRHTSTPWGYLIDQEQMVILQSLTYE